MSARSPATGTIGQDQCAPTPSESSSVAFSGDAPNFICGVSTTQLFLSYIASEQGALWQDPSLTIPVNTYGQAVGGMKPVIGVWDALSGSLEVRPTWQYHAGRPGLFFTTADFMGQIGGPGTWNVLHQLCSFTLNMWVYLDSNSPDPWAFALSNQVNLVAGNLDPGVSLLITQQTGHYSFGPVFRNGAQAQEASYTVVPAQWHMLTIRCQGDASPIESLIDGVLVGNTPLIQAETSPTQAQAFELYVLFGNPAIYFSRAQIWGRYVTNAELAALNSPGCLSGDLISSSEQPGSSSFTEEVCAVLPYINVFNHGITKNFVTVSGYWVLEPIHSPLSPGAGGSTAGNSYEAVDVSQRNIVVWDDCGFNTAIGRFCATDIQLSTVGTKHNGGIVFGHAYIGYPPVEQYYVAEVDQESASLRILFYNGFQYTVLAQSAPLSIVANPNTWYRLLVTTAADVVMGVTDILTVLETYTDTHQVLTFMAEIATTVNNFPIVGLFGFHTNQAQTAFSFFEIA